MNSKNTAADLPVGFTMALAQNGPAMAAFAGMDALAREELIARARAAKSKADHHSAQQNYHTTGQVLLSMLSFSNYFQGLLWKVTFHVSISLFHVKIYDILNKIRI